MIELKGGIPLFRMLAGYAVSCEAIAHRKSRHGIFFTESRLDLRRQSSQSNEPILESCVMTIPKLSILIITYNHARFIAKGVESVLEQITRFSLEINILDDCSTDGTSDILRDF
ncbi:MAG: glycosyltransferase, partial [Aestuariivirga sp.]